MKKAFTLIELMIVVTIISVLSMLAVMAYKRFTLAARTGEAQQMLGSVRAAQETYFQAYGQYCGSAVIAVWPDEIPFESKIFWNVDAIPKANAWKHLGLKSPGQVWFQYRMSAGANNADPNIIPNVDRPWYWARAVGDFDGNAKQNCPDDFDPNELVGMKCAYYEVTSAKPDVFILGEGN